MEHLISEAIIYGPGYFLKLWPWLWPWGIVALVVIPLMAWWIFLAKIPFRHEGQKKSKK